MIPTDTTAPDDLRLAPINPPGLTIAIPVTVSPSHDDDRFHFRLRFTEEDARTREALCEIIALRARGVACLVSFGDRPLGRCVVELLTAPEYVFPDEYRFELVLRRKKLPAASPEKDRSDGQAEEQFQAKVNRLGESQPVSQKSTCGHADWRPLATWAQELLTHELALAHRDTGLRYARPDGSLGIVRVAVSPEDAIRDAVVFGIGLYQPPCYALASTDPGRGG